MPPEHEELEQLHVESNMSTVDICLNCYSTIVLCSQRLGYLQARGQATCGYVFLEIMYSDSELQNSHSGNNLHAGRIPQHILP